MMNETIGQKLLLASERATSEVVLVAPFVKKDALRRILRRIPEGTQVKVIARWIPGEILAGVCDLEIFEIVCSRPNTELFVHPLLHAKSYRFDELIYIGSANLTGKALGWAFPSNLEILESAGEQSQAVRDLETHLLATSKKVDAAYRDEMEHLVLALGEQSAIDKSFFEAHIPSRTAFWLPKCRDPRRLWLVYSDPDEARKRTVESAYRAAVEDLESLGIPQGLLLGDFRNLIAATLNDLPIVREMESHAIAGLKDSDAINLVGGYLENEESLFDASNQWEILREWLLEFFPGVYRRDTYPEVFRIAKIIAQ